MSATAPIGVSGSGTISVNSTNGNYAYNFALDIEANKKYAVGITGTLENQNEPLKIAITSISGGNDVSNSFQIKLFNGISDNVFFLGVACECIKIVLTQMNFTQIDFYPVDVFVNTACPRIAIDDAVKYAKPMITPYELEVVLGEKKWEDGYKFDEIP